MNTSQTSLIHGGATDSVPKRGQILVKATITVLVSTSVVIAVAYAGRRLFGDAPQAYIAVTVAAVVLTALSGTVFAVKFASAGRRQDLLHESEQRFRSVIGAMHEAMVLRDRDGRIQIANSSVEKILRFPVEKLFHPDRDSAEWTVVNQDRTEYSLDRMPDTVAIETGVPQSDITLGIERYDGTVTWLSVSASPLFIGNEEQASAAVMTFTDISERKAAFEANARLAAIVDSSPDGIIGATLDGVIVNWNPGAERLFGYTADEIVGSVSSILAPPDEPAALRTIVKRLVEGYSAESLECIRSRKDKTPLNVSITYSLIRNSDLDPIGLAAIVRDITERKQYEAQIEEQMRQINEKNQALKQQQIKLEAVNKQLEALAMLDGLTGLKNHRVFQERLLEEFKRAIRYNTPLSIFILDVDQFKNYNDTYGHPAGDLVLKTVAKLLQECTRASDVVARYGGEEFVVILPQTSQDGALVIAERCRAMIESYDWPLREVTASFGVNSLRIGDESSADLISGADQAMYRSKAHGKNQVTHACSLRSLDELFERV